MLPKSSSGARYHNANTCDSMHILEMQGHALHLGIAVMPCLALAPGVELQTVAAALPADTQLAQLSSPAPSQADIAGCNHLSRRCSHTSVKDGPCLAGQSPFRTAIDAGKAKIPQLEVACHQAK